jgi:hypothetical protein
MYYFFTLVLPANTPVLTPVVQVSEIQSGVINFIEVEFPYRCEGLAHVKILYNTVQIVPYNPPGDLYGDDRTFKLDLHFPVNDPPYELTFQGWNDDDTYQHQISIGVMMDEPRTKTLAQTMLEA